MQSCETFVCPRKLSAALKQQKMTILVKVGQRQNVFVVFFCGDKVSADISVLSSWQTVAEFCCSANLDINLMDE